MYSYASNRTFSIFLYIITHPNLSGKYSFWSDKNPYILITSQAHILISKILIVQIRIASNTYKFKPFFIESHKTRPFKKIKIHIMIESCCIFQALMYSLIGCFIFFITYNILGNYM